MEDTIAAISTSLGVGAVSIIRVSGEDAIRVVDKIFDKNILNAQSHTIHYGHIIDNNDVIDEVLVSVMKSPKTFTRENIVEVNCHGGIATTNKVLELILRNTVNKGVNLDELTQVVNMVENFRKDFEQFKNITQVNGDTMEIVK